MFYTDHLKFIWNNLKTFFHLFWNEKKSNKNINIAGDFNLNILDHSPNKKNTELFKFNLSKQLYSNNKPIRATGKTSDIIDHILINSFVGTNIKTFVFKIDISDYFPICFLQRKQTKKTKLRILLIKSIEMFKHKLYKTSWDDVINNKNPNDAYN